MAISHSTKQDLIDLLHIDPERIDVTHLGTPDNLAPLPDSETQKVRKDISRRMKKSIDGYVVALSSKDPRKNIVRTIQAFDIASKRVESNIGLVILGHLPKDNSSLELLSHANTNVLAAGPVDDAQFARYLGSADALVFMSLYEGFGLPILEAMASGVPVIGSSLSSIPEVIGNAGLLANPHNTEEIANQLVRMICNTSLREACIRSGIKRASEWSWDRTASSTLNCYKQVLF